ncbi:hypothetical protein SAMN06297387_1318 [Streptomyces zhaozhouensis]|uniref:Uncharacterized protein n=1 Tax=Streptomyces zhaozhouensis TaxID=1300267 RepID=A0A286E953_9ACTN|nr:hypothetical protein [Streptomyces zhaozhouensis]SOD67410.1 hypothetical protein SAMN06297387_1318 [Streptomyces zhaozhouensis]
MNKATTLLFSFYRAAMTSSPFLFTTKGTWTSLESDPVFDRPGVDPHDDCDKVVKEAGYSPWTSYPRRDLAPMWLEIWVDDRLEPQLPKYRIEVSGPDTYDVVYAESTPALMELLSRWAPAIQSAAVTDLIASLNEHKPLQSSFVALLRRALGEQR